MSSLILFRRHVIRTRLYLELRCKNYKLHEEKKETVSIFIHIVNDRVFNMLLEKGWLNRVSCLHKHTLTEYIRMESVKADAQPLSITAL